MQKFGKILVTIGFVIAAYLLLLVVVPFIADVTVTANTTMNATSNMSLYPGTSGFMLATPWILFFVPGTIGIIAVIIILRQP